MTIMQNIRLIFPVLLVIVFISACGEKSPRKVETPEVEFRKEGTLRILRQDTDSLLVEIDIEIADNEYETQTGLMYRDELGEEQGMLFVFPDERMHSFYMKNTRIALDLLFIDSGMEILNMHRDARPLDESGISSVQPVQYVLEVNSGFIDRYQLQEGDHIRFSKD